MAVKFPLEVKNGVKARNISELRENFDVEKVVGYFLDGKLKNWLDARYYEEEAEAIEQLSKNDGELAKKLCEIFDVEYDLEEIDQEEIARKNERLAKLKQFTTDEEVISNIDSVAFDQEELAELYDMDVQKIYLCGGFFSIPKSKQNIKYILIGEPEVKGLLQVSVKCESDNHNYYIEKTGSSYELRTKINSQLNVLVRSTNIADTDLAILKKILKHVASTNILTVDTALEYVDTVNNIIERSVISDKIKKLLEMAKMEKLPKEYISVLETLQKTKLSLETICDEYITICGENITIR